MCFPNLFLEILTVILVSKFTNIVTNFFQLCSRNLAINATEFMLQNNWMLTTYIHCKIIILLFWSERKQASHPKGNSEFFQKFQAFLSHKPININLCSYGIGILIINSFLQEWRSPKKKATYWSSKIGQYSLKQFIFVRGVFRTLSNI